MTSAVLSRPASKWPAVPRIWPGETVVCMATGPSLIVEDVEYCRGRARVVAINDAYRLAPWADVLYAGDKKWWTWHKGAPGFSGLKYTLRREVSKAFPDVVCLKVGGMKGIDDRPEYLRTGANSGFVALNLAVHLGASRIVLLGYDMQRGPNDEGHWFGEHPNKSRSDYDRFLKFFPSVVDPLARLGVEVVNCTRETALTVFPRVALREALP